MKTEPLPILCGTICFLTFIISITTCEISDSKNRWNYEIEKAKLQSKP